MCYGLKALKDEHIVSHILSLCTFRPVCKRPRVPRAAMAFCNTQNKKLKKSHEGCTNDRVAANRIEAHTSEKVQTRK